VERWPLDRLIPHARNARTHSDEQVAQIAGSIAEFGFVNPVLVGKDGVIVAGHGRVMAARKLGLTEAPVIVLSHLTPTQRRALMIADNQITPNAGWNDEMPAAELASLKRRSISNCSLRRCRPDRLLATHSSLKTPPRWRRSRPPIRLPDQAICGSVARIEFCAELRPSWRTSRRYSMASSQTCTLLIRLTR
jgi:hypothetical protein